MGKVAYDVHDYSTAEKYLAESLRIGRRSDGILTPFTLHWLGAVAGAHGQPIRAAWLFGACEVALEMQNKPLPSNIVDEYESHMTLTRAQLAKEAFDGAKAEGKTMTFDELIAYRADNDPQ